jgi:hypothetical protein
METFSRSMGLCRALSAMTRDEYRKRIATFRGLAEVFQGGRVSAGQSGGSGGMLFLSTPDGKEWFWGGAEDPAMARAIAEAVHLALDLIA